MIFQLSLQIKCADLKKLWKIMIQQYKEIQRIQNCFILKLRLQLRFTDSKKLQKLYSAIHNQQEVSYNLYDKGAKAHLSFL
ncbi:unnamed protein product (macronuclear) [Paramecium tetraurelia]|uniref:Uncharacterized protein n=1 Tax=Paramecium tetraurelia TaxID=5888 RepID=A0BP21_PARTE|nr:uncharacterized protein GSPATT00030927001 [Paramecium tetraurelia]CAK60288.1 unnamed protein product [Paramecium tetraurelia]|eukprot:XP_001427686.1 hypothetical protein (macronuclear) [Paramecium tetraurelia strain d4-2]